MIFRMLFNLSFPDLIFECWGKFLSEGRKRPIKIPSAREIPSITGRKTIFFELL
jgi:hypothetical protein